MAGRPRRVHRQLLWPLLVPAALAVVFLIAPIIGLLGKVDWANLWSLVTADSALTALRLSLGCSLIATAIGLVLGVPLAWVLSQKPFTGQGLLRAIVTLPMVLPPVVGGVALMAGFGANGVFGRYLNDWFGVQLPSSTAGVVIAEAFVSMPFLIITVEGALRSMDHRLEEAGASLGASPLRIIHRVTLPAIWPSLVAGGVLAWARALGEFGATITFAGNYPGKTQTVPVAVYTLLNTNRDAAMAMSLVMLVISVVTLVALRGRYMRGWGLR